MASRGWSTLSVHAGERRPGPEGSVIFPIFQGTVYDMPPRASYEDIRYLRMNNTPTQQYLQEKLAVLEGAEEALAAASGMAVMTAGLLAVLKAGDHFLAGDCLYGGTHGFITRDAPRLGLSWTFVDARRPETWARAVRPRTKLFLLETITNPLMQVPALEEAVAFARRRRLVTMIDNTFAGPVNFRPLAAGFDLSFHSATKYLNGHSDLVAGAIMGSRALIGRVRSVLNHLGGSLDPHAAFLLSRGLKTLAVRMKAHNENGLALARMLERHPRVLAVHYPGLERHPDYPRALRLFSGFGGMVGFRVKGGAPSAERVLRRLRLVTSAVSLGGVESLATRPAATTHGAIPRSRRLAMGVTDDLLRLSCGIENAQDLVEDVQQALK